VEGGWKSAAGLVGCARMRRPLVIPTLLCVSGILLGDFFPVPLRWLFASAVLLLIALLLSARWRTGGLWLLVLLAGWTNQVLNTAVLSPHDLRRQGCEPALVTLRGRLAETPYHRVFERREVETWRTIALVDVDSIRQRNGDTKPAFGRVAVSTPGILPDDYFGGREVEIGGVLGPPRPPMVPGGFDYQTYLRRQGIHFQLRTESTNDWRLTESGSTQPRPPVADRFRAWAQRTLAGGLPVEDEPLRLLWTMTLGWKTGMTAEVSLPFMRSGTMHIFAISGLHIALIAGILVALLRVLQVPRGACGLAVIPLIWLYTGVTGWQASAIRSTVMMTVIIAGWSLKRPSDLLNSLAAAAFVILVWDPQQMFQASFQLSFFCVLSLALFSPIFQRIAVRWIEPDPLVPDELRPRWQRWLARPLYWLTAGLATSFAAWIGSMPLIAYYFNLFTPVSLLANLVIVPLSSLALMSNLASLVVGAWWPGCAELFNHAAWLFMWLMVRLSEFAANLPGGCFHVRPPSALTFVLYYSVVISATAGWLTRPRLRAWVAGGLAVLSVAWVVQWQRDRAAATITVLPLSGGSAVFCRDPGQSGDSLVDAGSESAAEFALKPFLRWQGVDRLDHFFVTHGDVRQIGGAQSVVDGFSPREILTSPVRFRSPNYRQLLENERLKQRQRIIQAGDTIGPWTVLHPAASDRFPQADDAALVLLGEWRGVRLLLLSDLGRPGQEVLLKRHPDLRADLVVTGLPATGEPLAAGLLHAIHPSAIIVADADYPANRRAPAALRARLERLGIPVFYTRESGAVSATLRAGKWKLDRMVAPPGRPPAEPAPASDAATE
jgi:competence protein ComEC